MMEVCLTPVVGKNLKGRLVSCFVRLLEFAELEDLENVASILVHDELERDLMLLKRRAELSILGFEHSEDGISFLPSLE